MAQRVEKKAEQLAALEKELDEREQRHDDQLYLIAVAFLLASLQSGIIDEQLNVQHVNEQIQGEATECAEKRKKKQQKVQQRLMPYE